MASFHISNGGSFFKGIVTDLEGYIHTTADEWMAAPVAGEFTDPVTGEYDEDWHREWAEETAATCREAVREAEANLAKWQEGN